MELRRDKKISTLVGIRENLTENFNEIEENLNKAKEFKVDRISDGNYVIRWHEKKFFVSISYVDLEVAGINAYSFMGRNNQSISDRDLEVLKTEKLGTIVEMKYHYDILFSFHLHIKLMNIIMPDLNVVLDLSSCNILNKEWIKTESESLIGPNPDYLVNIHGVVLEDGTGWYHTHGLERCGFNEIEISRFLSEDGKLYYNVIETVIKFILGGEFDDFLAGGLFNISNSCPFTLIKSTNNIENEFHGNNFEIKVYATEEDYNKRITSNIEILKDELENNPLFLITNKETERMSLKAKEREGTLLSLLKNKENTVLIKFGLKTDNPEEHGLAEHLCFEILEEKEGLYQGVLLNQPYYIKKINEGDILWLSKEQITDWKIYYKDWEITPDTVYMLWVIHE